MRAKIQLPTDLEEELLASDISIYQEMQRANPELELATESEAGTKSTAEVLTATAQVVAALSPALIVLLKRIFPHRKLRVVEKKTGKDVVLNVEYIES